MDSVRFYHRRRRAGHRARRAPEDCHESKPQAMLSLAGDAERELSHAPLDLDNLSDADEIRIGDELARSYESGLHSSQQSDTEKQTEAYIQRVGDAVSEHAQRKLPYRFHNVPRASFVNALPFPEVTSSWARAS
jgi:hypothetical protein